MPGSKLTKYCFFILITVLSACIENDIPYPTILGEFTSFEVEHQKGNSVINSQSQTVDIELEETGDPAAVKVLNYSITEGATISPEITTAIDLRDSAVYTISTYQDYVWTIKATQSIERYFRIDNQVGNQLIDAEKRTAKAFVVKGSDLNNITVTGLKLAPPDATYEPDPSAIKDFTAEVSIKVSYRDIVEEWTLSVEHGEGTPGQDDADIEALLLTEQVDGSETEIADITVDQINGFIDINVNATDLSALTINDIRLSEGATCEWQVNDQVDLTTPTEFIVTAGSGKTKTWLVRAHPALELQNSLFTQWHMAGKVWNPYAAGTARYWCTGNEGVVTLSDSNTVPIDNGGNYQGARLETVSMGFLGGVAGTPIAAGNMFIGDFVTNISSPAESAKFGRPAVVRPKQLHCQFDYSPAINEETAEGISMEKGDEDYGHIWIKIMHVADDTGEFDPVTHLPVGAIVIGEGELVLNGQYPAGSEATIDINYDANKIDKAPTHMAIVATSSYYGEFFVGGVGSVLNIMEMALIH
ncbi:PCMD domain-containing protein [Carboxylicivirga mesophila]|uniref:PCMD domain-containing protein n=1 Tax=Carboxylicivirga mesophila TaxID=1166478 RepID=A0ABS5K5V7_9BACT|nr:PCMD domain-containing protein [Carboxylicivirga mesophila]MBS2210341.1 PCMD domain-containing protein [Carboxylicivirga mesophila]